MMQRVPGDDPLAWQETDDADDLAQQVAAIKSRQRELIDEGVREKTAEAGMPHLAAPISERVIALAGRALDANAAVVERLLTHARNH